MTLKFEATPEGILLNSEGTDPQGKPMHGSYTSKFDGKDPQGAPVSSVAVYDRQ